jgi:hypothetical protein
VPMFAVVPKITPDLHWWPIEEIRLRIRQSSPRNLPSPPQDSIHCCW